SAAAYPVQLRLAGHLVYSPHDTPPSYAPLPWYSNPAYPNNLPAVWDTFWGYLDRQNIAPVFLGAFGSKLQTTSDQQWGNTLISYMDGGVSGGTLPAGKLGVSWSWWAWNPTAGDTGGILNDDWSSVNPAKVYLLLPAMSPIPNPGVGYFHTSGNQILDVNNQ